MSLPRQRSLPGALPPSRGWVFMLLGGRRPARSGRASLPAAPRLGLSKGAAGGGSQGCVAPSDAWHTLVASMTLGQSVDGVDRGQLEGGACGGGGGAVGGKQQAISGASGVERHGDVLYHFPH